MEHKESCHHIFLYILYLADPPRLQVTCVIRKLHVSSLEAGYCLIAQHQKNCFLFPSKNLKLWFNYTWFKCSLFPRENQNHLLELYHNREKQVPENRLLTCRQRKVSKNTTSNMTLVWEPWFFHTHWPEKLLAIRCSGAKLLQIVFVTWSCLKKERKIRRCVLTHTLVVTTKQWDEGWACFALFLIRGFHNEHSRWNK